MALLTGQSGGLTVTALIGLAMWVYAQLIGLRKTAKPKRLVQIGGALIEASSKRKSLIDILTGK